MYGKNGVLATAQVVDSFLLLFSSNYVSGEQKPSSYTSASCYIVYTTVQLVTCIH